MSRHVTPHSLLHSFYIQPLVKHPRQTKPSCAQSSSTLWQTMVTPSTVANILHPVMKITLVFGAEQTVNGETVTVTICVKRLVTAVWIMTSGKCCNNIFTSKGGYRRYKEVSRYYMISARHFAVLSRKFELRNGRSTETAK